MKRKIRPMMRRLLILIIGLGPLTSISLASGQKAREQLQLTAKGRTGPVGLKLTLLRNKIKVGESLFVKITLTNFSKNQMSVVDWIYRGSKDLSEVWTNEICNRREPLIEILGPNGHRLKPDPYIDYSGFGSDSPFDQTIGTVDAETSRHIKILESQGLSDAQINERLRKEEVELEDAQRNARYPGIILKQGQSAESVPWCSGRTTGNGPTAIICPGNGFVEMATYTFERPGRYRIRAVLDERPSAEFKKWEDQWDVRTATDWIFFEVSR